jgi:hypothetical protein
MFITGIVNFGGFMDFLVLQNTRLNIVMKIADLIATGIRYVLWKLSREIGYLGSVSNSDDFECIFRHSGHFIL